MLRRKMLSRSRPLVVLPALALVALALAGCATSASGGGQLQSADGVEGHFATFGMSYKVTQLQSQFVGSGRLNGTYRDAPAGVSFRFTDLPFAFGPDAFDECQVINNSNPAGFYGEGTYSSTDKSRPGTGTVLVAGCDLNGTRLADLGDFLLVSVRSGPFYGYGNGGFVTKGNITAK